jgi:hypothetical protein
MFRDRLFVAAVLAASSFSASISMAQVVKTEPKMGALREGQRVLVDDGKCPSGQIMEVIGGNHRKVGGTKTIERTRRCIPKQ